MVLLAGPVSTNVGVVELLLGLAGVDETITGAGNPTFTEKLQLCPPSEIEKVAVPELSGVPEIAYTKLPEPFAKTPPFKFAVKPLTPEDGRFCNE
jgi:hypothetical protein